MDVEEVLFVAGRSGKFKLMVGFRERGDELVLGFFGSVAVARGAPLRLCEESDMSRGGLMGLAGNGGSGSVLYGGEPVRRHEVNHELFSQTSREPTSGYL